MDHRWVDGPSCGLNVGKWGLNLQLLTFVDSQPQPTGRGSTHELWMASRGPYSLDNILGSVVVLLNDPLGVVPGSLTPKHFIIITCFYQFYTSYNSVNLSYKALELTSSIY